MQSTVTKVAPTQVELEIPLAEEEIVAAQQRAFTRLARNVKMPGFRPGKVPRHLFEQTYGTHVIESEALDDLAPVVYERALQEHDLEPLGRPEIEILPHEADKPTRLRAKVEVRPELQLGEYRGVEVEITAQTVDDADVERSLQTLRKERATLVPVERPAKIGDVVTLDYSGKIDDNVVEGTTATGQQTELLEERFVPGFAAGIAGMSAGETKTFTVTFPLDYAQQELAGKDVSFTVTVHDVKEIELPELDDEFAKAVSESQTLDDLKAEIRRRLEAVALSRRRRAVGNAVIEKLLASIDVPIPQGALEREVESMLAETAQDAQRAGFSSLDEYAERVGETMDGLRERYRQEAMARVKGTFVIEAIAKAEHVEATPDEVKDEIDALARRYGQPAERMRKALRNRLDGIREGIVRSKTLDLLVDSAQVRETVPKVS
jgi:trigger factor